MKTFGDEIPEEVCEKTCEDVELPPGVVTVTVLCFWGFEERSGAVAQTDVLELTPKDAAGDPVNVTPESVASPVPVIVITVEFAAPLVGEMLETVGATAKVEDEAIVFLPFESTMTPAPDASAGTVAVIVEDVTDVGNVVAPFGNTIEVTAERFVPEMVTVAPTVADAGEKEVIVMFGLFAANAPGVSDATNETPTRAARALHQRARLMCAPTT